MEFLVGDLVRVRASFLERLLDWLLGAKAGAYAGRVGVITVVNPLSERPQVHRAVTGDEPVYIRVREGEIELLAPTPFSLGF